MSDSFLFLCTHHPVHPLCIESRLAWGVLVALSPFYVRTSLSTLKFKINILFHIYTYFDTDMEWYQAIIYCCVMRFSHFAFLLLKWQDKIFGLLCFLQSHPPPMGQVYNHFDMHDEPIVASHSYSQSIVDTRKNYMSNDNISSIAERVVEQARQRDSLRIQEYRKQDLQRSEHIEMQVEGACDEVFKAWAQSIITFLWHILTEDVYYKGINQTKICQGRIVKSTQIRIPRPQSHGGGINVSSQLFPQGNQPGGSMVLSDPEREMWWPLVARCRTFEFLR